MTPRRDTLQIIQIVAQGYRVPARRLLTVGRRSEIVRARRAAMVALRAIKGMSPTDISRVFGCNHTTACWHLDRLAKSKGTRHDSKATSTGS